MRTIIETTRGSREIRLRIVTTLIVAFLSSSIPGYAAELRAFVVGIDDYQRARPLVRAVSDARSVAAILRNLGYEVVLLENPGKHQFLGAVSAYAQTIGRQNTSFLFFAGHGVQVDGSNFLIPRDVDPSNAQTLLSSSVPMAELLQMISRQSPLHSVVVLDACRDRPFGAVTVQGISSRIASVIAPTGFYIVYSAGSGESALDTLDERDTNPNGVFTRALIHNLSDTNASFDSIVKRARRMVRDLAASVGHSQVPAIYDQTVEEFYLSPSAARTSASLQILPIHQTGKNHSGVPVLDVSVLSIGVAQYRSMPRLMSPHRDAAAVKEAFDELGVRSNFILLDPTLQELWNAIDSLARGPDNTIIVYFSGMGWSQAGKSYLMAVDSPTWGVVQTANDLASRVIPVETALKRLSNAERRVILLLDTVPGDKDGFLARLAPEGAQLEKDIGGLAVLYATSPTMMAFDIGPGLSRSSFSTALTNALAKPRITMESLAKEVTSQVVAMTRGQQIPSFFATPKGRQTALGQGSVR